MRTSWCRIYIQYTRHLHDKVDELDKRTAPPPAAEETNTAAAAMMYGDPAMSMGNQLMLTSGPGMGQPEQYQQGGYAP
jgi:hypothetical protein